MPSMAISALSSAETEEQPLLTRYVRKVLWKRAISSGVLPGLGSVGSGVGIGVGIGVLATGDRDKAAPRYLAVERGTCSLHMLAELER